jgi:hypothetical protein
MKKKLLAVSILTLAFGAVGAVSGPQASAHNRGKVELPNGGCAQTGSLKSVALPEQSGTPNSNVVDGELRLDLRPETSPQDEIGTAFAAAEGLGVIQLGDCP